MDTMTERVKFSYVFTDEDDGTVHKVVNTKNKDSITADELCEMFIDFMTSAGYSIENVYNYFENGGY